MPGNGPAPARAVRRDPLAGTQQKTEPTRDPSRTLVYCGIALAAAVSGVRLLLGRRVSFCGTPDACYYLGMAQNLAAGQGFHARFLYDFQQAHPTLPNTGIEYWRPGISLLLLLLKPFGGVTLYASTVLTTLVGVLFSAAAWHLAVRTFRDRRWALGSFALCLLSSYTWVGSATPDSGLYYGAAVAWFLALFTVQRQGWKADLLALLCVGLAYLIRNDGAMLLVPLLAVLWARRRVPHRAQHKAQGGTSLQVQPPIKGTGASWIYAGVVLLGFAAALAPMHLIYRRVLGTAFPSGTAQVLFLNDLSDFGRYRDPVSLHSLLAHGVTHLVTFRVATLATVVYRVAVLMVGYPALVFLPGLFARASKPGQFSSEDDAACLASPEIVGAASFAVAGLFAYTVVLPAIGGFSALRTAVGLMPLASVLVMLAIARSARNPRVALWLASSVIAANALAGLMEARRTLPVANLMGNADRAEAHVLAVLAANPASAVVLTNDPVQFSVTTGYAAVALPSNGIEAIAQAAQDFHATYVILDSEHLPATVAALEQRLHPIRSATLEQEHSLILQLANTATKP